nr:MAG TPA: hypothetical protein [Bacteriophage sp.]
MRVEGFEPIDNSIKSRVLYQLSYKRLRIVSDHTTGTVAQPPIYKKRSTI